MKDFFYTIYRKFFSESFLLVFFCLLSLFVANISDGYLYRKIINFPIFLLFQKNSQITISNIVNDGLMVFFFLLIGLEIKYELVRGELKNLSHAMLPIIAALGGMIFPVIIYKIITYRNSNLYPGWAIPIATDIAFAVGILSAFKNHSKFKNLRVFLTTLAIIDDIGSIIVILFFYHKELDIVSTFPILLTIVILLLMNFFGIKNYVFYLFIGVILWGFMFFSEMHPTLSGIIVGLIIPIDSYDKESFSSRLPFKKLLYPFVSYFILPLFSFINAGINFKKFEELYFFNVFDSSFLLLPIGIFLGLFIGKPIGIISFVRICLKLKFVKLLKGISFRDICSISILCGIGFTMSIFITNLAFDSHENQDLSDLSKVGIVFSSIFSSFFGYFTLKKSITRK